ncbi:lipoprotein E precursor [Clostridium tepidiprofundi DSM 19306]|uniref:Lipoprotein E n=1 Tax=Clostridium tepidiprofundi DSM 19306 TaxID=1121338 RepID=A0A151B5K8_9CLOT|nr:5'-nucleotidase, lipoprotein e(P4) family [Clostridium tepidiprofundi]KYH35052.1 lipoprotein E precursor [Clostridium tepidiprofundi DSM 19306]
MFKNFLKKTSKVVLASVLSFVLLGTSNVAFALNTYTVQKGDTLAKIGSKYGIDWKDIVKYNNIKNPNLIYVGDVLKLEAPYTQKDLNEQLVMATDWVQTSAEYRALCYQAYNMGKIIVDENVANYKKGDKPLAIVTDIDETILDNSAYDAGHIGHNDSYNGKTWSEWVNTEKAKAMPGSVEFLKYAADKGVTIFYMSNRKEATGLKATINNLKALGFPYADNEHMSLKTDTSNKQPRRDAVTKDYNVILYMGDNVNDFPIDTYHKNMHDRNELVDQNKGNFGTKFIMLPNPLYGDWEGALSKNSYWGLNSAEKDAARKAVLDTWRPSENK